MDFNLDKIIEYYILKLKNNHELTDKQRELYEQYLFIYFDSVVKKINH